MRVPAAGRLALLLALAAPVTGCSLVRGTARSYVLAPSGLEVGEERLRDALAAEQYAAVRALVDSKKGAPDDAVLRDLYRGTVAYYAGDYEASARALQRAYDLTEDRYTKSVSRGALSMLTNDRALPYVPGDNERLMVHYYGMQGFLARGDVAGAAVEARRLASQLERFDERRGEQDASTRATLRFLTGAVFDAAGERADAEVAYRNARALLGRGRDSTPAGPPVPVAALAPRTTLGAVAGAAPASGTVVVVLEEGYVAHRVEQSLSVALSEDEVHLFGEGSDEERARSAERIGGRWSRKHAHGHGGAHDEVGWAGGSGEFGYLLQVALPAYRRSYTPSAAPGGVRAGAVAAPFAYAADLSDAAEGDFARDRVKLLTRAIARAGTKYALAELASRKEKKDEAEAEEGSGDGTKGKKKRGPKLDWGRMAVNLVGVALERADTRSWHLLPARISVARLELPAGRHTLQLDGGGATPLALEGVEVRAGETTFVTRRLWRGVDASRPASAPAPAVPVALP